MWVCVHTCLANLKLSFLVFSCQHSVILHSGFLVSDFVPFNSLVRCLLFTICNDNGYMPCRSWIYFLNFFLSNKVMFMWKSQEWIIDHDRIRSCICLELSFFPISSHVSFVGEYIMCSGGSLVWLFCFNYVLWNYC